MQKGKKTLFRIKLRTLFFLLVFVSVSGTSQVIQFAGYRSDSDTIINHSQLASFFNKLHQLDQDSAVHVVNILHIGDSHIQADILTAQIRKLLMNRFGNAGRGLIFPLRMTRTNESRDYRSSSSDSWSWQSIRKRNREFEPGIAGVSLRNNTGDLFEFGISIQNNDTINYTPDSLDLICRNDSVGRIAFVTDNTTSKYSLIGFSNDTLYTTRLSDPTTSFTLKSYGDLIVDGMVLKNSNKGIRYHVTGINGAHLADYNSADVFFKEAKFVQPDLIMVSLGTNEGVSSRISTQYIINEVEKLVSSFRRNGIDSPILIITPFSNYFHRRRYNTYLKTVATGLVEAAVKNNLPCMDMYNITGGLKSAGVWSRMGLFGYDKIHFNAAGYKLQGDMIYKTLINSYNKYADF